MRQTVREYAIAHGVSDRTVRLKLARGKLPGGKTTDPVTGLEVWYVDVSEEGGRIPDPNAVGSDPGVHLVDDPTSTDLAWASFQEVIEKQQQQLIELAGRCGFYQAKLQEAEAKIALLEAPKSSSERGSRPWWQFWRPG